MTATPVRGIDGRGWWSGIAAAMVAAAALMGGVLQGAEVPREKILEGIKQGCEKLIAKQKDDGSFELTIPQFAKMFPVGNTALGVVALEYARPHVDGELRTKVHESIRKGLLYITTQPPEKKTYSASLVIVALYQDNPEKWQGLIGEYARMLVLSQHEEGYEGGQWGYQLRTEGGPQATVWKGYLDWAWGDKSNTQFALLGLYYAERAGYQVPKIIWKRSVEHYKHSQFKDGGWGYHQSFKGLVEPYANMTIASTISMNLCEEMLRSKDHGQCVGAGRSKEIDAGLKWISDNWTKQGIGHDTYGLYALERLGIIMGYANIGGHDWYNEGAATMLGMPEWSARFTQGEAAIAFGVMFLARGLEPIVINKLERKGTNDWNNDPYDVKHLTEFIADKYQVPVQWRIVTLEAPLELLLRTPMLYISGHKALSFNDAEKEKLKAYVVGGGTIIGQACCSKKEFDVSFRALVKELYGSELRPIPATHRIYERMKVQGMAPHPEVETAALGEGQGRPVVIYLPHDQCCLWQVGAAGGKPAFAVGSGIYFYVTMEVRKMFEEEKGTAVGKAGTKAEPIPAGKQGEEK